MAMPDVIDLYMAHYAGRDDTRAQRLGWWREQLAAIALQDLTDDHVHAALEALATQPARYWSGKDADGRSIFKAKRRTLAPATVNRYGASLAAVVTWAIKRRVAPKGFIHPCRSVERRVERNERTRYLSDDERYRLLDACRQSTWPRLYVLVLMALTTGARKSELISLRWSDVDLDRCVAHVGRTKNGDPRVLPLVPAVIDELRRFSAGPSVLLFPSARRVDTAFTFEPRWLEALKRARIRGFTFHALRHSCASMLAQSGATLLEIADVLGHRQMQMTKRYSHLATTHKAALVQRILGGIK
ncbi:MAG: site-specific integrase [Proteobacteria bacterium]|nr:site-specific integrase [Pseudomonadota bacterium]